MDSNYSIQTENHDVIDLTIDEFDAMHSDNDLTVEIMQTVENTNEQCEIISDSLSECECIKDLNVDQSQIQNNSIIDLSDEESISVHDDIAIDLNDSPPALLQTGTSVHSEMNSDSEPEFKGFEDQNESQAQYQNNNQISTNNPTTNESQNARRSINIIYAEK